MIYLFDIDGTLTVPQQQIQQDMEKTLLELQKDHDVYLVTGSDRELIRNNGQFTYDLDTRLAGIFTCQGSELWQEGKLTYRNDHSFDTSMITELDLIVADSSFNPKTGKHINERPGMINFTVVGRNATTEQRKLYAEYDVEHKEREAIAMYMRNVYTKYDFSIGGEISIDINLKGQNKSQVLRYLRSEGYGGPFSFFGDKTHKGGNDYTLARALIEESDQNKVYQVDGPDTTISLLNALI